jgi:hypothetical protein
MAAMKKLLVVVIVLLVSVGALGYWQGWFGVTKEDGKLKVKVDPEKFKADRAAWSKAVGEKAKSLKDKVAGLRKQTEGLTGDAKARAEKELQELISEHDQLDKQIKELKEAGDKIPEEVIVNLTRALEDLETKIEGLTKKLGKEKDK